MNHPSGEQVEIEHGDYRATIVSVGGGVRTLHLGRRPVLQPYPVESMCDGAHGAPLIPWPNRLADGKYRFDGQDHQVALTEPDKHNAIHGFLRWRTWTPVERDADRAVMATVIYPMQGYPFTVDVRVTYRLTVDGLDVTTTATNFGDRTAPYGCGQHPYLSPGDALVDACTLRLGAATRILTDPQRELPTGAQAVAGTAFDFNRTRLIGDLAMDFAFTDLVRDDEGRARVELGAPDGWTAGTWVDESFSIIELYTADTLAADRQRRGLGTEPMTMPPNGFQSGDGLVRLQPGQAHTTRWGAYLRRT